MRVRGNSIRLRLTRGEVAEFGKTGLVEETIEFGGENELVYALESKPGAETVTAEFEDSRIVVTVPRARAEAWAGSNEIGIEAEQPLGGGKRLRLLIEKDFACLESREGGEDADTFPHPSENARNKKLR